MCAVYPSFELFGKTLYLYALLGVAGVLLMGTDCYHAARRRKLDENDMVITLLFTALGVLAGSHLLYGLTQVRLLPGVFAAESVPEFLGRLWYVFGGSVFYGGLLGGAAVFFLHVRRKRFPLADYTDVAVASVPLLHAFGRVGCFFSGCCYGMEWEHGISFTHSLVPEADGVPRLPVQLMEAAFLLLLYALLRTLRRRAALRGGLIFLYALCYGCFRFVLEFFRGDAVRGFAWVLSTSQWISLALVLVGAAGLLWRLRRRGTAENPDGVAGQTA